ncbi:hypothetical protein DFJ58DRAFT_836802 [Suillus subalutaceus]|uniref:uncharacterized protein n=1 Tax=Suillus subalutaceus TaxID=48586 RepID=UPI001B876651|nr:uncharacterized protein DFJ58DRAFT_836802 [Suillus subalutaceus]KAG1872981.1 hypothetical protein DFJ58DRAFT_836802 [Suillus subalutaceus]
MEERLTDSLNKRKTVADQVAGQSKRLKPTQLNGPAEDIQLEPPSPAIIPKPPLQARRTAVQIEEAEAYQNVTMVEDTSKDEDNIPEQESSPDVETPEDELKRLMKEWTSPVYAFFNPTPRIVEINGRHTHEFKCHARGCKTTIRRFLNKKDARSTGNMQKHVKSCWGNAALTAADDAKDAKEVQTKIVTSIL